MLFENKILRDNINTFRNLLTESIIDKRIIDAINNYKYLYIYYDGDETITKGYRTIRPYRLGAIKSQKNGGQLALRAWQEKGTSDSFKGLGKQYRPEHEYWDNKPGWRLFLVNNITEVLPIGKRFVDQNGKVDIPPKYKETDEQIPTAVAYVSMSPDKEMMVKGTDSVQEPDKVAQKVDKSAFASQAKKFSDFYNVTKQNKRITKDTVRGLYDMIRKQKKKSPNDYMVAIDRNGDFRTIPVSQKDKYPKEVIVGNLMSLYDKMVRPPISSDAEMRRFVDKAKNSLKSKLPKDNITNIPLERKNLFK